MTHTTYVTHTFIFFLSIYKICELDIIKKTKESLRKKTCTRYQNLSEEEKTKIINMVVNDIEVFLKMKNKGLLSTEKIILKYEELITG